MPNGELKVLDLTRGSNDNTRTNNFRKLLGKLFSKPYSPHESERSYIPTQYLAEYIKNNGFDGVQYLSSLNSEGINICIFIPEKINVEYKKEVIVMKSIIEYR